MIRDHIVEDNPESKESCRVESFDIDKGLYDNWINASFTKVILQAKNKAQLLKPQTYAEKLGLKDGEDFIFIFQIHLHDNVWPIVKRFSIKPDSLSYYFVTYIEFCHVKTPYKQLTFTNNYYIIYLVKLQRGTLWNR